MCEIGMDEFLAKQNRFIREHGHAIIDTPDFAYTVGLSDRGLPEVIVFGFDQLTSIVTLNMAAEKLRAGTIEIDSGQPTPMIQKREFFGHQRLPPFVQFRLS